MSRKQPYKTHMRRNATHTACNLTVIQPTRDGVRHLPLAKYPSGITCLNCLEHWYPPEVRYPRGWRPPVVTHYKHRRSA